MRPPGSLEWTDIPDAHGPGGEKKFGHCAWDGDLCDPPHLLTGEMSPNQPQAEPILNPAGTRLSRGDTLQPHGLPTALGVPA